MTSHIPCNRPGKRGPRRVALVSMPWHSPQRPSAQVGVLSAWLKKALPDITVDTFHFHLSILTRLRYPVVKAISEGTHGFLFGEALSACLLFPGHRDRILAYLHDSRLKTQAPADLEQDLLLPYERFVEECARTVEWSSYDCVGFSAAMAQTLSSLLMVRMVKERAPSTLTILGGSEVTGPMGTSLLRVFPEIDLVVSGEGERPLTAILETLQKGGDMALIPGVLTRHSSGAQELKRSQISDLDTLPDPDYRSYFRLLSSLPCRHEIEDDLAVPVEGSRGCWWANRKGDRNTSCAFCNLNHQWKGYREKTPGRWVGELRRLSDRHPVRRFLFLDNVSRKHRGGITALFTGIRDGLPRPLEIVMEARADTVARAAGLLREAGVVSCQTGIESLSTRLLKRIGKGTTAIRNVEAMKALEQRDIINPANLLYGLPGITVDEVEENIRMIPFVKAYYPLRPGRFSLVYGSPYWETLSCLEEGFGNDPAWKSILPEEVERQLFFSKKAFPEETPESASAVERLKTVCDEWLHHYTEAKRRGVRYLLGSTPDGTRPGGLIIRDFRERRFCIHRLAGTEAEVYLFFEKCRTVRHCGAALPHITGDTIERHLSKFVDEKLLLREGPYALNLAIPLSE